MSLHIRWLILFVRYAIFAIDFVQIKLIALQSSKVRARWQCVCVCVVTFCFGLLIFCTLDAVSIIISSFQLRKNRRKATNYQLQSGQHFDECFDNMLRALFESNFYFFSNKMYSNWKKNCLTITTRYGCVQWIASLLTTFFFISHWMLFNHSIYFLRHCQRNLGGRMGKWMKSYSEK